MIAAFTDEVFKLLMAGQSVLVPGLGHLYLQTREARVLRNPVTKALMEVPATREIRFKPLKSAKRRVNE